MPTCADCTAALGVSLRRIRLHALGASALAVLSQGMPSVGGFLGDLRWGCGEPRRRRVCDLCRLRGLRSVSGAGKFVTCVVCTIVCGLNLRRVRPQSGRVERTGRIHPA